MEKEKRVGQLYRERLVGSLKESVSNNASTFIISYSHMTSTQLMDLRKTLKKSGAKVFVSKNRLAKIALKELHHEDLSKEITSQTALIWSDADSAAVAKILVNFAKSNEQFKVKGGILEDKVLIPSDVVKLSDLPSREVLLAMLLGTILSPVTRFAGILNSKSRDLLSILKQLSEKKGGS